MAADDLIDMEGTDRLRAVIRKIDTAVIEICEVLKKSRTIKDLYIREILKGAIKNKE